jgi:hypothetical protein
MSEHVGASTSRKLKGHHGLYRDSLAFSYDSSKVEVIRNILTEFGVPMKMVRIVKYV